jgi:TPR repeat protein
MLAIAFLLGASAIVGAASTASIDELREKAEAGDAEAQFRLGTAFDWGHGVKADGREAEKWYRRAAIAGYAEAQNSLGSALQAEKKYDEALQWYERAAAQNNPLALNNLAYLYDLGLGVAQDRQKAFDLYSRSANLGWAEAMWNISNMYGAGQLGGKDLNKACIWTLRAFKFAQPDDKKFAPLRSRFIPYLQRELSPEQFADCKAQAENWQPTVLSKTKQ